MKTIVLCLPRRVKMLLRRWRRQTRDAGSATRRQIVLLSAKGRSSRQIAEAVGFGGACPQKPGAGSRWNRLRVECGLVG